MTFKKILTQFKKFFSDEKIFFKNVSFVFGGKLFIVVLALFLTPVIARLYLPEDYGEYALYNMVVQNMVVIGTLSLPMAVITVKKKELQSVFNLAISIILLFTVLFAIGLITFNHQLDQYFSTSIFNRYWIVMLIGFLVASLISTLAGLNIQLQRFKLNTAVNVTEATSAKFLNLLGGWMNLKGLGLILSDVISKSINLVTLILRFPRNIVFSLPNLSAIYHLLGKLRMFPIYLMPSQWIGTISNQFIIWLVAYQFDKSVLGQLSMAIGLMGIPLNVLSNSFQPVITQRLVAIRDGDISHRFYEKTLVLLLVLAVTCFTALYLLPPVFFTWFLGNEWVGIDAIINIYCWYYILLLLDQAFHNGFIVFEKQKNKLFFNLIDVGLLIVVAFISISISLTFENLLMLLVAVKMIISTSRIIYLWRIARMK